MGNEKNFEFEMVNHDWMMEEKIKVREFSFAHGMLECLTIAYENKELDDDYEHYYNKIRTVNQKSAMMAYAESNFYKLKCDFESQQYMKLPAFFGQAKTALLFYLESLIVFARNTLDVAASVYSKLLFGKRTDSYNKFCKLVLDKNYLYLQRFIDLLQKESHNSVSAYKLLCGEEQGRALRDIIIHQASINIEYYEYMENSELERLFFLPKGKNPIEIEIFISNFIIGVENLFSVTSACCKEYLISQNSNSDMIT